MVTFIDVPWTGESHSATAIITVVDTPQCAKSTRWGKRNGTIDTANLQLTAEPEIESFNNRFYKDTNFEFPKSRSACKTTSKPDCAVSHTEEIDKLTTTVHLLHLSQLWTGKTLSFRMKVYGWRYLTLGSPYFPKFSGLTKVVYPFLLWESRLPLL